MTDAVKRALAASASAVGLGVIGFAPAAWAAEEAAPTNRPADLLSTTGWAALAVIAAAGVIWLALELRDARATQSSGVNVGTVSALLLGIGVTVGLGSLAVAASNPSANVSTQPDAEIDTVAGQEGLSTPEPTPASDSEAQPTDAAATGRLAATPLPFATPRPTATPRPVAPQLAAPRIDPEPIDPAGSNSPQSREGLLHLPLADGVRIFLSPARPLATTPGISAIYFDEERSGEIDIFVPYASVSSGQRIQSAAEVVQILRQSVLDLAQLGTMSVDGYSAVYLHGRPSSPGRRVFHTTQETIGNDLAGWLLPEVLHAWVIDGPSGPLVVTAETTVANELGFLQLTIEAAEDILSSMSFQ